MVAQWIYANGSQWVSLDMKTQQQIEQLWVNFNSSWINCPTFQGIAYVDFDAMEIKFNNYGYAIARQRPRSSTMQLLPFEILKLTFRYLSKEDVLQGQLTSKTWYDASVELLHSYAKIQSKEKSVQYTRTISSSSRSNSHMRVIRAQTLIEQDYEGLDYLLLHNLPLRYNDQNNFEMYIRLSTFIGVKFCKLDQARLLTVDEHQYNQSEKKFRFEITCTSFDKRSWW